MISEIRLACDLQTDSIVDGEGLRTVIWTQGCYHNCLECHNPETHSLTGGKIVKIDDIKAQLSALKEQDGITFSGGDPILQVEACLELAKYCHSLNLNVWCYTGFTYDQLLKMDNNVLEFLKNIDVLIDGKFDITKKSFDLKFKGSSNQRVIDMKKTLETNSIVLYDKSTAVEEKPILFV